MSKDMTDEEFAEFLRKNKDRVRDFVMSEGPEFIGLARKEVKKGAKKAKAGAKEAKEFAEETKSEFDDLFDDIRKDAEESDSKVEQKIKEFASAVTSEEVQKHFIKMGMEFMLGLSALVDAVPKPGFVDKAMDKASEVKKNASKEYCANNKDCPKKEIKRIELE